MSSQARKLKRGKLKIVSSYLYGQAIEEVKRKNNNRKRTVGRLKIYQK